MEQVGFLHFIEQSDAIGKVLFAILVIMSITTWSLLIFKMISFYQYRCQNVRFLKCFEQNTFFAEQESRNNADKNRFELANCQGILARITLAAIQAQAMYRSLNEKERSCIGEEQDFLMGVMQKNIKTELALISSGLTVSATIAATAPFIGLFGTVWGVYHALLAIGSSGIASLDQIASPVGEALIMTGVGLAVAVPAVIIYNWLLKKNKVVSESLEAYVFDLLPSLLIGRSIHMPSQSKRNSCGEVI